MIFKPFYNRRHISFKASGDKEIQQSAFFICPVCKIVYRLCRNSQECSFLNIHPFFAYEYGRNSFNTIKYFVIVLMLSYKATGMLNERLATDSLLKTLLADLSDAPRWADGSGLSRYNLFTPRSLVQILKKIRSEIGMERVQEIFPSGGEGTLRGYYVSEQPYLFAKTGTLSGVVALSGYMSSATGRPLIFSVLVNNHRASASEIRRAVERFLLEVRGKY